MYNIGDKVKLVTGETVKVTGVMTYTPQDDSPRSYRVYFFNDSNLHFEWRGEDSIEGRVV